MFILHDRDNALLPLSRNSSKTSIQGMMSMAIKSARIRNYSPQERNIEDLKGILLNVNKQGLLT